MRLLLLLILVLTTVSWLWAAEGSLDDAMQVAMRLPPRQACEALGRLREQAAAAGRQADFDKLMMTALFRYEVDREATLADPLAKRRQILFSTPAGLPTEARVVEPWPTGNVSPDGNLQLLRDAGSLRIALRSGVVLTDIAPPPEATVKAYPSRFADWRTKHVLKYGSAVWSPDALAVAWSVNGVIMAGTLDGKVHAISQPLDYTGSEGLWDDNPMWSPGGHALMYTRTARDRLGRQLEPRILYSNLNKERLLGPGVPIGFVPTPGRGERVLLLGGQTLYMMDPFVDEEMTKVAAGVLTGAASPDGSTVCVIHAGRVGLVPLKAGPEHTTPLPTGWEVAQPPVWLSQVSLALTLRQGKGADKHYTVWVFDSRTNEFKQLTEGYLWPWNHNAQQIATSAGLLQLQY